MTKTGKIADKNQPLGKNEDVKYQVELADENDLEAQQRATAADRRQQDQV